MDADLGCDIDAGVTTVVVVVVVSLDLDLGLLGNLRWRGGSGGGSFRVLDRPTSLGQAFLRKESAHYSMMGVYNIRVDDDR